MLKLQCDPMAAMLLGAADSALSGVVQSTMDGRDRAQSEARSVVGDLMGWSRDAGMSASGLAMSEASLGNLPAPSGFSSGRGFMGQYFGG